MNDRELLWKRFEMDVGLYKNYLDLFIKYNALYYAITGALVSYYFIHRAEESAKLSLVFPFFMSLLFAVFAAYAAILATTLRSKVRATAQALGFTDWPEVRVLVVLLWICSFLSFLAAIGIGYYFIFG